MHWYRFVVPVLLSLGILLGAAASFAQMGIGLSITIAPPLLPVYVQPPIPAPGYIWTPGYWAYGPYGYFWVPGTWVQPPAVGLLWTPGYWGWNNGVYVFNPGYWGPHVGFYGGINYGFGYGGVGYQGGYWNNGAFNYNRAVNNISDTHITNVYNRTVVNNTTINNVSYNGGSGGTVARPTPQEQALRASAAYAADISAGRSTDRPRAPITRCWPRSTRDIRRSPRRPGRACSAARVSSRRAMPSRPCAPALRLDQQSQRLHGPAAEHAGVALGLATVKGNTARRSGGPPWPVSMPRHASGARGFSGASDPR